MKLLTKEILEKFKKLGSQMNVPDPIVVCKFFNPTGAGTWYATEYDKQKQIFYGYVSIFGDHNDEWGSFSLYELESFKSGYGLGIERDLHFNLQPISTVVPSAVIREEVTSETL